MFGKKRTAYIDTAYFPYRAYRVDGKQQVEIDMPQNIDRYDSAVAYLEANGYESIKMTYGTIEVKQ